MQPISLSSDFDNKAAKALLRAATVSLTAAVFAVSNPLNAQQGSELSESQGSTLPSATLQPVEMPIKTLIKGGEDLQHLEESGYLKTNHATLTLSSSAAVIEVPKNTEGQIEIMSSTGMFDAEGFTRLVFELKNEGDAEVKYELRLENPGATPTTKNVRFFGWITPGQSKNGNVLFPRKNDEKKKYPELSVFGGMKGLPGGLVFDGDHSINPGQIEKIKVTVFACDHDVKLSLGAIYASHPPVPPLLANNPKSYFPFIDSYGQFMHEDWPGKVKSDEDLKKATEQEELDLEKHPGPEERSKFGGWLKGPQLKATGYFRPEKYQGKWWLVDPEGYLFWSSGVTCVGMGGADTPITGRGYYFSSLPDANSPLASFYGNKGELYMFTQANLFRKYGPNWFDKHRDITQRRLKSWGLNTLGNWSNPVMTGMHELPYVTPVEFKCDTVTWRKFPDVFSPNFRKNMHQAFETKSESFNDPWCIGFFVQNELKFGGPVRFMEEVLGERSTAPCKVEWVKELKSNYHSISRFNQITKSNFSSWDELLANNSDKNVKLNQIADVATDFYKKMCTLYFQTCREEQKRVAPHQLYLGCRFLQNVSPVPVQIAAQFCDVVSFNVYEYSIASRSVEGLDKPFIIGEFHFGALDRGMFGPGCTWAGDQQDRAGLYKDYVTGGLKNPNCVGAHWFQYSSQAFTGRPDGEDFQVGLLDITANPYPELRDAMREVGYGMYETRFQAQ